MMFAEAQAEVRAVGEGADGGGCLGALALVVLVVLAVAALVPWGCR